jgi:L,D-peptidoglycan transpeptidase YkuD (ErfK/YbiS/YcfS/YnhG family)
MRVWHVIPDTFNARKGRITGPLLEEPCALGRAGVIAQNEKTEGDGKSPIGSYPLRQVFYRPDRVSFPVSALPVTALSPELGWCDDPTHARYNKLVRLPFGASHEKLWRDDAIYDLIMVIGHNDDPVVTKKGSAVFVHVARDGFTPTEGCVALARPAMQSLLRLIQPDDKFKIG